jgi:hypothetical protein
VKQLRYSLIQLKSTVKERYDDNRCSRQGEYADVG